MESVTSLIQKLKVGDVAAAQQLWQRYFRQLLGVARKRLENAPRRVADEEDAVVSAFRTFFLRLRQGSFAKVDDRDDLWRVLVTLASRKAAKQAATLRRQKRGGARVRGESALVRGDNSQAGMAAIAAQEPTPAFAVEVTEQFERLMDSLNDDVLRRIALLKLEGYSNEEIADALQCGLRTVERRLRVIRTLWCGEEGP